MNDSRRRLLGRYSQVGFTIPASHILLLLLVVLGCLPTAAVFADGLTRPTIPSPSFSTGFTASPSAPPRNPLRVQIGPSITLLDEAGRLARPVNPAEVVSWRQQIQSASHGTEGRALAHLHIGEWELAQNRQPETARWHFEQAQKLTAPDSAVSGLCAYDLSVALFYQGAYQEAFDAFHHLLSSSTKLSGYDRRNCALWLRHSRACAGYHTDHAKLGIPEPPRLDSLNGAASLAACFHALSLPSDRQSLLRACRVTGEGSTLQDLMAAGKKFGLNTHALTADDQGLIAMPKPLVAYVE